MNNIPYIPLTGQLQKITVISQPTSVLGIEVGNLSPYDLNVQWSNSSCYILNGDSRFLATGDLWDGTITVNPTLNLPLPLSNPVLAITIIQKNDPYTPDSTPHNTIRQVLISSGLSGLEAAELFIDDGLAGVKRLWFSFPTLIPGNLIDASGTDRYDKIPSTNGYWWLQNDGSLVLLKGDFIDQILFIYGQLNIASNAQISGGKLGRDNYQDVIDASGIDTNIKAHGGKIIFESPDGTHTASIDASGNCVLKGTLTQNGAP